MIYVHVPFCRSFCTYCDFYSELACKGRDVEDFGSYADAICAEISDRAPEIAATTAYNTIYIGGGTPSVLPLSCLERIAGRLMEVCGAAPDEFTIEVNPEDILEKGPDYLHALRDLGVDRISMGVQSLDDRVLKWMNRRHDAKGAEEAFRMIREAGFGNISVDLIFGYPDCHLEESLKGILSWAPDHISAYQLSIEDGSALAGLVRDGKFMEADDEQCREQYELICSTLRDAGFCHYEISNWALPGKEARHNAAYWKRLPYVGLGPGAHSFDGSVRSWNREDLKAWTREQETLSEEDSRVEAIMLGLRTARGIEASLLDEELCCRMISDGSLIALGNGHVRIPEALFFVSDDIISSLV